MPNYQKLAEFRHQIRRYLHFSEEAAHAHGLEPQQHQLLLALKALPPGVRPTVSVLAERLCLRHHSTVELINRLVERKAIVRRPCEQDRREVLIEITPAGDELLSKLTLMHWQELEEQGPKILGALESVLRQIQLKREKGA